MKAIQRTSTHTEFGIQGSIKRRATEGWGYTDEARRRGLNYKIDFDQPDLVSVNTPVHLLVLVHSDVWSNLYDRRGESLTSSPDDRLNLSQLARY
jgi:hypothetical protein